MIVYFSMLDTESDRDVFRKLYEENRQMLFGIAYDILRNKADAEDAVHTCFLRVADNFAKYRHKPYVALVKLCCTIVRHAATDIAREYQKKTTINNEMSDLMLEIPDIMPDIPDQLIEQYEGHLITQALFQLEEDERDFLVLQYIWELKPKVIGELLGMSSGAVRKKMLKCRNKLAKILEGKEYEGLR